jgi:hypothetical protein
MNKIYIRDEVCVVMREHDERSMSNNQQVIAARNKATSWYLSGANLDTKEKRTLQGWSHYFCAIHLYLDHKNKAARREISVATKLVGWNKKFVILFIKTLVGRKIISKLK